MKKQEVVYLISWHGRGRTLMSLNVCKDRKSIQEYINTTIEKCKGLDYIEIKGNSPDYFGTIDHNDCNSGIFIRSKIVNEKFGDCRLLSPNPV